MKMKKLQLENFRNYSSYSYDFEHDKEITIILGPNGQGKTNFLEAVYTLSLGKSFRTSTSEDLINWDNDYLRCNCEIAVEDDQIDLEVFYSRNPRKKNFKRNGVNLKNSDYLGSLLTVLFHPEDLNMLYLSPSLRRKYLDVILSQTDKKYLRNLSQFKKVLKHRNALLQEIREFKFKNKDTRTLIEDLDIWDFELVKFANYLLEARKNFVNYLNDHLEEFYSQIADEENKIDIEYDSKTNQTEYSDLISLRRDEDIRRGETSTGPHRDDIRLFINGKDISKSASRGEYRTLLLAMKLIEIHYIKDKTGENPILLLDDVFSELDKKRQEHLIRSIKGCQTIITSNDLDVLTQLKELKDNIKVIEK